MKIGLPRRSGSLVCPEGFEPPTSWSATSESTWPGIAGLNRLPLQHRTSCRATHLELEHTAFLGWTNHVSKSTRRHRMFSVVGVSRLSIRPLKASFMASLMRVPAR